MKKEKYALLVIDMQLVAFDGKITPPIINGPELLDAVSNLIKICRDEKVPIVFLQTCAFPGQPYAKDVHGWEIHEKVFPEPSDRIVYKVNSSGFDNTNLQEVLVEIGADSVITCGIWSEYCLTATSKSALELNYKVYVAADGHSTVSDNKDQASRVVATQNQYLMQESALVVDIAEIRKHIAAN